MRVQRFRVKGSGSRVQGSGIKDQGLGFRVRGSGSEVLGLGSRVQDHHLHGILAIGTGGGALLGYSARDGAWVVARLELVRQTSPHGLLIGFRVVDFLGFRVQGFRVQGLGFRV